MTKIVIEQYLQRHGFEAFHPKAVLFDMDGVIYDSMPNHAKSWHESMASFGLDMTPEEAYMCEGMRGVETIKKLAAEQWNRTLDDAEAAEMYRVKSAHFSQCPPAQKMKGVEQLMRHIKAQGLSICVVTGSGQQSLLDKLVDDFDGLIHDDLIVSSKDVTRGKPNPEPYLRGMEKLGIEPWQGIVVENAPLGVRAAVAARLFTIAVNTGPLPDSALADEGANLVCRDMEEALSCFLSICRHSFQQP